MKNGQERRREKEKERGRDGGRKKRRTEGGKEEKNEAIRVPHVFWMKVASVISARAHRLTVYDTMYVPRETV